MSMNLLLRCNDVSETKNFYLHLLGFASVDGAEGTCSVQKSGGTLLFTEQDLWKAPPQFSGTIYFFVEDVDRYYVAIKDKVSVSWPLQDMPYGLREFGIRECNGYSLAFARRN